MLAFDTSTDRCRMSDPHERCAAALFKLGWSSVSDAEQAPAPRMWTACQTSSERSQRAGPLSSLNPKPSALTTRLPRRRSTYHGGCLQPALELFCGLLLAPGAAVGEAHSGLTRQGILFINGVMRNPCYRGTTSGGVTLTAASRDQARGKRGSWPSALRSDRRADQGIGIIGRRADQAIGIIDRRADQIDR